jgi:glucose-1-phosphate thymidylyltransferase
MSTTDKAVILARGLGTRMRKSDADAQLDAEQSAIAATGVKALMPIDRPFLDYVLHALGEAGYRRICLVIGPEHEAVKDYFSNQVRLERLTVDFAIQQEPRGTADAVSPARDFAGDDDFIVINSDNYYPIAALRELREIGEPALAGFEREAMLAGSNIQADRILKFAAVETDADGYMTRIIEKPTAEQLAQLPEPICVSMNCWRFNPAIFASCEAIEPSPRGELELPDAVMHSMKDAGVRYRVLPVSAPVLDMSSRGDVAGVKQKLAGTEVRL